MDFAYFVLRVYFVKLTESYFLVAANCMEFQINYRRSKV